MSITEKIKAQTDITKKQYTNKTINKELTLKSQIQYMTLIIFFENIIMIVKNLIVLFSNQSICFYTNL